MELRENTVVIGISIFLSLIILIIALVGAINELPNKIRKENRLKYSLLGCFMTVNCHITILLLTILSHFLNKNLS